MSGAGAGPETKDIKDDKDFKDPEGLSLAS